MVTAMSTTSPSSRRSEFGSARAFLLALLAVLLFVAGGIATWWYLTQRVSTASLAPTPPPNFGPLTPSPLAPSPEALPSPTEPSPEAGTAPAGLPPSTTLAGPAGAAPVRRAARPPVAAPAPPVTQMLKDAESASASKRYADAADLYERVLKVDPGNEKALAGRTRIVSMGASRQFVLGTTVVESRHVVGARDLQGFDASGIAVKRAPKVEGSLELVMEPPRVKPGEPYAVKVFLKNDGRKPIEVGDMKVSMIVDGKSSSRPLPPKARQVGPQQRALLEELPGIWRAGVNDWAVEAVVTSKTQDVYRNRLTWK